MNEVQIQLFEVWLGGYPFHYYLVLFQIQCAGTLQVNSDKPMQIRLYTHQIMPDNHIRIPRASYTYKPNQCKVFEMQILEFFMFGWAGVIFRIKYTGI